MGIHLKSKRIDHAAYLLHPCEGEADPPGFDRARFANGVFDVAEQIKGGLKGRELNSLANISPGLPCSIGHYEQIARDSYCMIIDLPAPTASGTGRQFPDTHQDQSATHNGKSGQPGESTHPSGSFIDPNGSMNQALRHVIFKQSCFMISMLVVNVSELLFRQLESTHPFGLFVNPNGSMI